ncbi:mitochondrial F1-F0 ATP synthase subunit F of fungi-domain-containing protein [Mycena vulgaris]|nr:mitochondrial F1-F0 ATP synthase subunit F of fungi-domain-containing protein [Mycena vulgaris]
MYGTLIRRSLGGLVSPKIASRSGSPTGSGPLTLLVSFYSALPKSPASTPAIRGLKARFFSGKNASAGPVLGLIGGLFLIGYTLDYQLHLKNHKNAH